MIQKLKDWWRKKQEEALAESKRSDCPNCGAKADVLYMHGKKTGSYHCWNCGQEFVGLQK